MTIGEVIKAYRKKAFRLHPERVLKHFVDQHNAKKSDENDVEESADNEEENHQGELDLKLDPLAQGIYILKGVSSNNSLLFQRKIIK